eukprot:Opistho-1_new@73408
MRSRMFSRRDEAEDDACELDASLVARWRRVAGISGAASGGPFSAMSYSSSDPTYLASSAMGSIAIWTLSGGDSTAADVAMSGSSKSNWTLDAVRPAFRARRNPDSSADGDTSSRGGGTSTVVVAFGSTSFSIVASLLPLYGDNGGPPSPLLDETDIRRRGARVTLAERPSCCGAARVTMRMTRAISPNDDCSWYKTRVAVTWPRVVSTVADSTRPFSSMSPLLETSPRIGAEMDANSGMKREACGRSCEVGDSCSAGMPRSEPHADVHVITTPSRPTMSDASSPSLGDPSVRGAEAALIAAMKMRPPVGEHIWRTSMLIGTA